MAALIPRSASRTMRPAAERRGDEVLPQHKVLRRGDAGAAATCCPHVTQMHNGLETTHLTPAGVRSKEKACSSNRAHRTCRKMAGIRVNGRRGARGAAPKRSEHFRGTPRSCEDGTPAARDPPAAWMGGREPTGWHSAAAPEPTGGARPTLKSGLCSADATA
jgi:hypothetical protein